MRSSLSCSSIRRSTPACSERSAIHCAPRCMHRYAGLLRPWACPISSGVR
nr:MAG TPA: hypothetical protein [Bacteriophage sp.]